MSQFEFKSYGSVNINYFMYNLEMHINNFGLENVFGNVVEELTSLATDGIVINVDSTEKKIYFVCGTFLGNKMNSSYV